MNSLQAIAMTQAQPSKKGIPATSQGQRRLREAQTREDGEKLSHERIAEKAFTSKSTVGRFFNGHPVEIAIAKEIVRVLGLQLADVVDLRKLQPSEENLETLSERTLSHQIFTEMFAKQKERMTSNPLTGRDGITLERERMYVPLGLLERKKLPRVKETEPETGSRFYVPEDEVTRKFENDEFFSEVIERGNSGT